MLKFSLSLILLIIKINSSEIDKLVYLDEQNLIKESETVLDLLWASQRHRLQIWANTFNIVLNKSDQTVESDYSRINSLSNEELRNLIRDNITKSNSQSVNKLNKNPHLVDALAIEFGIIDRIHEGDSKYGKEAMLKKFENIIPLLKYKIEKSNRTELIELLKFIDNHIKRGRHYLARGVLDSIEKMDEIMIRDWIYRKIVQNPDLNSLKILDHNR